MNYTVLVVEDEHDQRRALIERVKWNDAGFEVIGEAENGVEAIDLVETLEPDLIITDGGKGQMEVVREVIEDELNLTIPIAGLAKDNRHRTSELLFGFPPQTIGIKQQSPLFRLLTQIQDEVHRFAISFHRDKRSKRQVASALDNIKGIGEKTKTALLKEFKSVKRIKEASFEEISAVIGEAKAKTVKEGLGNEQQ